MSGLTNRYGCRPITIVGSLISCAAFLISTVAPNSFVLLLTYGIMGKLFAIFHKLFTEGLLSQYLYDSIIKLLFNSIEFLFALNE